MAESFNFATEADDLLRRALEAFAAWAAENYRTTEAPAAYARGYNDALAAYARGYNDALAAIPDALDLWIEEYQ